MERKIGKDTIIEILLMVGIACFFIAIFVTNIFHFNYKMNADIASDTILSGLIWESGQFLPDTWYVASEVRIICTPNLAALFYGLSHNMVLSMGLACSVMTLLIVGSIFWFLKTLGISRKYRLIMEFIALMIPNGFMELELSYLFVSYYAIHIVILFYTLAIYADWWKTEKIKWGMAAITVVFAFVLGVQGVRGILVLYGPLFGMECIRNVYLFYSKQKRKRNDIIMGIWVLLLLVSSFLGTVLPISVGQGFSRNIRKGLNKLVTVVIPDMYRSIGFENVGCVGRILLLILLLGAGYVLAAIVLRMLKREVISVEEWTYLILCSSPVVTGVIVAFTTVESSQRYYFLFHFVIAYGVLLLYISLKERGRLLLICVSVALAVIIFNRVYVPIMKAEEPHMSAEREVVEYLVQEGYTNGYATFEYANTMTVIANGEIRIAAVASIEKMDICKWMTSSDWYVPNVPYEEKTVYIVTESQLEEFAAFSGQHDGKFEFVTKIGKYHIFESEYNFSNLGE